MDGNKRTAYEVTYTFIARNGRPIGPAVEDAVSFMVQVAQGHHDVQAIAAWLREQTEEGQGYDG